MNHIASTSKYFELWGFDEPENSCEYGLAKKLADNFSTNYLNPSNIYCLFTLIPFYFLRVIKSQNIEYIKEEVEVIILNYFK